jgi:hypothetical protein
MTMSSDGAGLTAADRAPLVFPVAVADIEEATMPDRRVDSTVALTMSSLPDG